MNSSGGGWSEKAARAVGGEHEVRLTVGGAFVNVAGVRVSFTDLVLPQAGLYVSRRSQAALQQGQALLAAVIDVGAVVVAVAPALRELTEPLAAAGWSFDLPLDRWCLFENEQPILAARPGGPVLTPVRTPLRIPEPPYAPRKRR